MSMQNLKVKKGDTVKIISGKDRGKTGKILRTYPADSRILVEGVNQYKKHVRPRKTNEKGQIVVVPRPLHVSNVQIMCSSCGRAVRIGYQGSGNEKERVCKRCSARL